MIISREYVTFRRLINSGDPAGELYIELFRKSYPEEYWDKFYERTLDACLYQRDMGWGFTKIAELIKGFKKLDRTHPYDNGLSFADVTDTEILDKDENGITLLLINKASGEIVKVVEITK